jgi:hypothetical protein
MSKIVLFARHCVAVGAALASFALVAAPIQTARGQATVTVDNSATNPALTSSVDDPGRTACQSTKLTGCINNGCSFSFPAVPVGHRLVVQHVSVSMSTIETPQSVDVVLQGSDLSGPVIFFSSTARRFDQSVLFYFDGGDTPGLLVSVSGASLFNILQVSTLIGYLLDCTAAPCAVIAH